jgi:hypothetical protein
MRMPVGTPLEVRFWDKVQKTDGCWLWTAAKSPAGYGCFTVGSVKDGTRRLAIAPRVSWELAYGPIPDGMFVCHRCDIPACVRPDHLFLGTPKANIEDCVRKGRHVGIRSAQPISAALKRAQTHCKRGHEFMPANTVDNGKGGRVCLDCRRVRAAEKAAAADSTRDALLGRVP